MPNLDNDFWRLRLMVSFVKARPPIYEELPCDKCSYGSLFCQMEDDYCSTCKNTGIMRKEVEFPKAPKIPEDLLEYMTKAYNEYKLQ